MANVKFNRVLTAREYLHTMTGKYYFYRNDDDIKAIHDILSAEGIENNDNQIMDFPLNEIDKIVENDLTVVLVNCYGYNDAGEYKATLRWFEIKN